MFRRSSSRVFLAACAMLGLLIAGTATAEGKQLRQHQSVTGLGLLLDPFNADFTLEFKGAPGRATGRTLVKLGAPVPPSADCSGSAAEIPVLGGSLGEIFGNFSKLLAIIDSGALCLNVDGSFTGHIVGEYVGGVGFEGASGTFTLDLQGVGLTPGYPGSASVSGSIAGTIVLD